LYGQRRPSIEREKNRLASGSKLLNYTDKTQFTGHVEPEDRQAAAIPEHA
jgi:hypothetical protein